MGRILEDPSFQFLDLAWEALMLSTLWEAWSVWLHLWEHCGGVGVENRSSCPPSQRPANHPYKYSLAWPGLAL